MSGNRGTKKGEKEKPIVNEIFLKFIAYTLDTFWQEVFHAYACGDFPKELTYKKNVLTYRKGNNLRRCEINDSDVKESYLAVKEFMRTVVRLYSPLDNEMEDIKMQDIGDASMPCNKKSWSEVKQQTAKNILITNFVHEQIKKYHLDEKSGKELRNLINFGFILKAIVPKDVIFKNGQISSIEGLNYDSQLGKFTLDFGDLDSKPKKSKTKTKKKVTTLWEGYLKKLRSRMKILEKLSR